MLTDEQKARILQRFSLFTEHMKNADEDGKGTEDIIDTVKLITLQMSDDERWISINLESAYTLGTIEGITDFLFK